MAYNSFVTIEARHTNIEAVLIEIKIGTPKHEPEDQLFTVQDAAKFLRLSIPMVYGLISKRRLAFMKRTKICYFSKSEVVKYLQEGGSR